MDWSLRSLTASSNGIRFSITDLSPETARLLPTVFVDRAGISLYDAQWQEGSSEAIAIPDAVINDVVAAYVRFKSACEDFGVPGGKVKIIATEATRTAKNSEDFRGRIENATGWRIEMLPKEEEGRVGAYGIASSFPELSGLVMDLGGGSTQLSWIISDKGNYKMSDKSSVSMPYGAAALTRRLEEAGSTFKGYAALRTEVTDNLKAALTDLALPKDLQDKSETKEGLPLYLSGGGFRGWGFVLMDQYPINPYPIPLINGFSVPTSAFHDTAMVRDAASTKGNAMFRISTRRSGQVPAVAFLVSCLADALPSIRNVQFCQGGVREGVWFSQLPPEVRAIDPVVAATAKTATPSMHTIVSVLLSSLPRDLLLSSLITIPLVEAFASSLYVQAAYPRDIRASTALRSTTTGHLASAHGLTHTQRACLALLLCERYGGYSELQAGDQHLYTRLARLLLYTEKEIALQRGSASASDFSTVWLIQYLGAIASLIAGTYPAGIVRTPHRLSLSSSAQASNGVPIGVDGGDSDSVDPDAKPPGHHKASKLRLTVRFDDEHSKVTDLQWLENKIRAVKKVGKKKNWVVPAAEGEWFSGMKVKVDVLPEAVGTKVEEIAKAVKERKGSDQE